MASVFSFNADPPRVSSPWLSPRGESNLPLATGTPALRILPGSQRRVQAYPPQAPASWSQQSGATPPAELLADYGVSRLQPEPQDGPHEYKLHLLLRPRRTYTASSTGLFVPGSQASSTHAPRPDRNQAPPKLPSPVLSPSPQSRQVRLRQLTTQLLWRLQQSSHYHASSVKPALPKVPDLASDDVLPPPGSLPAGLEESHGALYEIGVADDGSLVGLTEDEMEESLHNLHAMAASLGCKTEVLRCVIVGDCEWLESPTTTATAACRRQGQLWVAEVLVSPDLNRLATQHGDAPRKASEAHSLNDFSRLDLNEAPRSSCQQLRITLTGPTMSGKTTLLGTLSTATLDNGRGKSRMSLLKHRHELESGHTSSITQELIGYKDPATVGEPVQVINYSENETWTEIHTQSDRVVFVSDSAGHPRYRRTTVRGLIGWAPHWTALCIAANDAESQSRSNPSQDRLGIAGHGIDLAKAHLDLCLKLEQPMVIAITKLDLASKSGLRDTLGRILTALKAAGRIPVMVPPDQSKNITEDQLRFIPRQNEDAAKTVVKTIGSKAAESTGAMQTLWREVPIVLTSSTSGVGIKNLHALLRHLPIPPKPTAQDLTGPALDPEKPLSLFHIEATFSLPTANPSDDRSKIVAGHVRFGSISIGDRIVVGPFPADLDEIQLSTPSTSLGGYLSSGTDSSSPGTLKGRYLNDLSRLAPYNAASSTKSEWLNARIVSIRNLRLPVHTLDAGQVGTIGIAFDSAGKKVGGYGSFAESRNSLSKSHGRSPGSKSPGVSMQSQDGHIGRIRKGMILAVPSRHMLTTGHTLQAASGFTATFDDEDVNSLNPGMVLLAYVGSVRATARVLKLMPHLDMGRKIATGKMNTSDDSDDVFGFGDELADEQPEEAVFGSDGVTDVAFELITGREWIEMAARVLIMPGGGQGLYDGSERGERGVAGFEGFVGRIIEIVD